ncbi:HIT domain-containing protein [Heliobacterium undosum]|uniref:HIT domain-containing protein n=1 Tax=Heliomicrobium undosum TaxID=121734 RepID=A0A845L1W6_9FIRM|nr:HIT domain-containing protein [Heliomicrobium undosum]
MERNPAKGVNLLSECIFCRIIRREIPAQIVYEDEQVVAFRDINPVAPTHILIIPREHIASVAEATPEHQALLGQLLLAAPRIAEKIGIERDNFRLVINTGADAGQTVFHIHVHLLAGRPLAWPPG